MARFVVLVLSAALFATDTAVVAASPARVCRQACGAVISGCIAEGGRPRRCRRATVRRCRREGTSACLVPPTTPRPPTTVTTTTVTTTSSTTTTRPPQGLYGLLGTWDFTYSIISTFEDRYVMSSVQTSSTGVPFIPVYDVYDGISDAVVARPVDLGFTSFPFEFALLDASTYFCDFFVFNKTGANTVAGNYYLMDIDFDGSCGSVVNPSSPYPMRGVRTSAALVAPLETRLDDAPAAAMDALARALGSGEVGSVDIEDAIIFSTLTAQEG